MGFGDAAKVPTKPLRARLADELRSADRVYRRHTVSGQLRREHDFSVLAERIGCAAIVMLAQCQRW